MLSRLKAISGNYIMLVMTALVLVLVLFCGINMWKTPSKGHGTGYLVTDELGNKLSLAQKPQRIVSFAVSTDEMLLELVGAKRMIAVSPWSDSPDVSCIADKIKDITYRAKSQNLEAILTMRPDLVVLPDYVNAEVILTLKDAGINVYVCKTPHKIAGIQTTLLYLGKVVGEEAWAKQIIDYMNIRLQRVKSKVEKIPVAKRVRVLRMQEQGSYYAPDSSFMEICRLAGAKDATEDLRYEHACTLSQEEIVALNPDVFILENWNYDGKHDPEILKQALLKNEAYATTTASRKQKALLLPANHLLTVSQYIVAGVEDLAKALYPEYM